FVQHEPATPSSYALSLHDALPISQVRADAVVRGRAGVGLVRECAVAVRARRHVMYAGHCRAHAFREQVEKQRRMPALARGAAHRDRKSTRLNSSHLVISYAVFCLKKKKKKNINLLKKKHSINEHVFHIFLYSHFHII